MSSMVEKIIIGFVALMVGAVLVSELWNGIEGTNRPLGGVGNNLTINGTTRTFMFMVPWMSAIGLMVTAVTVFLVKGKGKRRL